MHHNKPLRFPDSFGVRMKNGAIFPAEACSIKPGQRYTKRLSPEDTAAFMQLSVSKPDARLAAIQDAVKTNVYILLLSQNNSRHKSSFSCSSTTILRSCSRPAWPSIRAR